MTKRSQANEKEYLGPPMVLFEGGLNNEQDSFMRHIFIEKCILVLKQVVLIGRVALILRGLKSRNLLYNYHTLHIFPSK